MKSEVKIGLVGLIAILILIWGINFLKGNNIFGDSNNYYAIYSNIDGLESSSPVRINGLTVGNVSEIYFHPSNTGDIIVEFTLNDDIRFPINTVAKIYNSDIMGTKAVQLIYGNSNSYASIGDTLFSDVEDGLKEEVNKQVLPLKNKAEELISSIDSVMTVITTVLDKDARESLSGSLRSLNRTFSTMELAMVKLDSVIYKNDTRVSNILLNVESITTNLHNNNEQISNVIRNFESISDSLAKSNIKNTIYNLDNSLSKFDKILQKIDNGEGTIGLLLNDKEMYNNLTSASKQLDLLIEDMKKYPKRYVTFSLLGGRRTSFDVSKDSVN
ncbi:MlaD family protein [Flavobacteriales bacterium]|nr:MlaD family protein [Flavobacteriales bacterium]MDB2674982.1 MlaD family protein [Flavobacteriales bacterium]